MTIQMEWCGCGWKNTNLNHHLSNIVVVVVISRNVWAARVVRCGVCVCDFQFLDRHQNTARHGCHLWDVCTETINKSVKIFYLYRSGSGSRSHLPFCLPHLDLVLVLWLCFSLVFFLSFDEYFLKAGCHCCGCGLLFYVRDNFCMFACFNVWPKHSAAHFILLIYKVIKALWLPFQYNGIWCF